MITDYISSQKNMYFGFDTNFYEIGKARERYKENVIKILLVENGSHAKRISKIRKYIFL